MSDWLDYLDDRRPITAIFGETAPSLKNIKLRELSANYDAKHVLARFDLSEFPEVPPKKWVEQGFNVVQIELALYGVRELSIHGWPDSLIVDITLDWAVDLIQVSIVSGSVVGAIVASMVYVRKISAYCDTTLDS